jgi:NAD(P)-dependent dehydrogenase (short-subunit alcohol dehydrogenase family)
MRNVVVSGGSRGLGLAISLKLAAAGYRAIAIARQENRELSAASAHSGANSLQFIPFDLEDIDAVLHLAASLRKSFGPIYGLVNNAALGDAGAPSLRDRYASTLGACRSRRSSGHGSAARIRSQSCPGAWSPPRCSGCSVAEASANFSGCIKKTLGSGIANEFERR